MGPPAFWKKDDASTAEITGKRLLIGTGGISGVVMGTKGADVVVLKVSDEVKMEFSRASIVQVKERGE